MRHPIQPIENDNQGVPRFKANAIVRHLMDHGGFDLTTLSGMEFDQNDREQFAQLIGYSLGGFSELSYVSEEAYVAAELMFQNGVTEEQAINQALRERILELEETLATVRGSVRDMVDILYRLDLDSLEDN